MGDSIEIEVYGYLFEGEVISSDNLTYARGQYIPKGKKLKAQNEAILLNFKQVEGIKYHEERSSFLHETFNNGEA